MQWSRFRWLLMVSALGSSVGCRFGFDVVGVEQGSQGEPPFDGSPAPRDADVAPPAADGAVPVDAGGASDVDAGLLPAPGDAGTGPLVDAAPNPNAGEAGADAGSSAFDLAFVGSDTTAVVGGAGGTAFAEACPLGYAITGYAGYVSSDPAYTWVMRIQPVCGEISVDDAGEVVIRRSVALGLRGADGDVAYTRDCPDSQLVVGFSGRAGSFLDQLVFACAPLVVEAQGAQPPVTVGAITELAPIGGGGGASFVRQLCPAGQVARGHSGRTGQWVDALGLDCGTPTPR